MSDPITPHALRAQAEQTASAVPALMARAKHLAAGVVPGGHGRRKPGAGDVFWQYRPAQSHEARRIDWRRSARGDQTYVQDREWQTAQSVYLWVDQGASMAFGSGAVTKRDRARVLAMALAVALDRGGERVGVLGHVRARHGRAHLADVAHGILADRTGGGLDGIPQGAHVVMIGDFLSDLAPLREAMARAVSGRVSGTMLQVLDPVEMTFPFSGRSLFETVAGDIRHETQNAQDLRDAYLARLRARQNELRDMARAVGWGMSHHDTDRPAIHALHWMWHMIGRYAA